MKRLITSMLIVLLISVAFIGSFYKGYYCYAIENEDSYRALTNDELDAALYSYIQSHGGGLTGISYEAMHTYNRGIIDNYFFGNGAQYTRSDLLNHIHVGKNQKDGLYFDFDGTAAGFLNTRFRQMLQDKVFGDNVNLDENGMLEPDTNNTLYNGKYFEKNGQGYLVTIFDSNGVKQVGTPYIYSTDYLRGLSSNTWISYPYPNYNQSYSIAVTSVWGPTWFWKSSPSSPDGYIYGDSYRGYASIGYNGTYYLGCLTKYTSSNTYEYRTWTTLGSNNVDTTFNTAIVNFNTNLNNNVTDYPDIEANGHLYITPKVKIDGEYKPYTVNEGDTINNVINNYYQDSTTPDKTTSYPSDKPNDTGEPPSGGNLPNWSNPYPNLTPDGNGGFNFNFSLPDLNIDWNISGLSEKFPFSIPFDLIRFVTILNAEPETPHFEGTVNLIVYEWNIDADLSQFDNLASIVRNVEFIGFCITLVLITRRMIKG